MIRNRIIYFIILLCLGTFSIMYNEYVTSVIFIISLTTPILSFLVLLIVYRKINAQVIIYGGKIINKNEKTLIKLKINNGSFFPISRIKLRLSYENMFIKKSEYEEVIIPVDSKSIQTISCQLTSDHCGKIKILVDRLRCYDYFKLFSLKKPVTTESWLYVVPRVYELKNGNIRENKTVFIDSDVYSKIRPGDDCSEVYDMREYREGDKVNRIHWKLSLKSDSYIVKDFSLPINSRILVMTDFTNAIYDSNRGMEYIDAVLETAFSISYNFIMKDQLHYMVWYNNETEHCERYKICDVEDIFNITSTIYDMKVFGLKNNLSQKYDLEYYKEEHTLINYICSYISDEVLESLNELKKGADVNIFIIKKEDETIDDELMKKMRVYNMMSILLNIENLDKEIKGIML